MEKIEIIEIKENNSLFSHFLKSHPHLIFHTFPYKKFIEEAFNTKYKILAVINDDELDDDELDDDELDDDELDDDELDDEIDDNNKIKLILPLVEVKSRLFGNKVISSAYLEYGGPAGDEKYLNHLIEYLNTQYQKNFQYLEIRGGLEKFDSVLSNELIKKDLYKRFILNLKSVPHSSGEVLDQKNKEVNVSTFGNVVFSSGSVPAVNWFRSNIQKSKRKAIKKAKNNNITVKIIDFSNLNNLDEFYELYCGNMRLFGSPSYNKKYFISFYKNIVNNNLGKIFGAYHQGKLVSALVGFCYQDRVHIIIAISDENYQEFRPNDAVHSEFIEWSIENGFKWFDFGRVREESGQFEYKQKWGPELKELPSYFLLWQAKEIPLVDPSQKKYRLALKLWQKLPLSLTKILGPKLRKGLGI